MVDSESRRAWSSGRGGLITVAGLRLRTVASRFGVCVIAHAEGLSRHRLDSFSVALILDPV
jgi:hypothetical protein